MSTVYTKVYPRPSQSHDLSWFVPPTIPIKPVIRSQGRATRFRFVHPRSQHESIGWLYPVVAPDAIPRTAPDAQEANSYATLGRVKLEVQRYRWDQDTSWIQVFLNPQVAPTVSQYLPPLYQAAGSYQTPNHNLLDVRLNRWNSREFGIPFDPALLVEANSELTHSYVTPKAKELDVRRGQWVQDTTFVSALRVTTDAQNAPVWTQQAQSFRTPNKSILDVRLNQWDRGTAQLTSPAIASIPTWFGIHSQLSGSYRTADGLKLDPRVTQQFAQDAGWMKYIVDNPPPPVIAISTLACLGCGS